MNPLNIRNRIIIPFVIVVLLILGIGIMLFSTHAKNYIEIDFQNRKDQAMTVLLKEINKESEILKGLTKLIISNPNLKSAWLEGDRENLYEKSKEINNTLLKNFDTTHFYFHNLDRTNFLRVHNPARFGDYIDRSSMAEAVRTKKVSSGIELGPYGTFTLRIVSPWIIDGKLVGYVELGKEMGVITDKFNSILDVEIFVSIHKEFLNREKWEEGIRMTGSYGSWDQFTNHVILSNSVKKYFCSDLDDILNYDHYDQAKYFRETFDFTFDGKSYKAGLFDAKLLSMKSIGEIVVIRDITEEIKSLETTITLLIIISLFISSLGFLLFWLIMGAIQINLNTANNNLILKIEELEVSKKEAIESKSIAETANRMKNDFLANVSHELRTPLNGILGMTGLILDTDLDEDQKEFLNMIIESGDHLFRIISDLLDFSQIETGNLTIQPGLFNLSNLVKNTISVLEPAAKRKNIKLLCSIQPEVLNYYGDRVRVGQILINLITNAIKYSEKGTIRVNIELSEELEISIIDTGVGIPEDKINTIFESFVQIENTYTKTHEGVGLGLSIVKQLVELLNGKINLDSKLGVGTTFKIFLPVIPAPEGAKVIAEKVSSKKSETVTELRIIIAEDEAINRMYIKKFLTKQGFLVEEAVNGRDVLAKLKENEFDLILMDMGMPEVDGIEATQRIREQEKQSGKYIKIIALTANAFPEDVRRCIESGMDHFVSKPIKEKDLLDIIEETMQS